MGIKDFMKRDKKQEMAETRKIVPRPKEDEINSYLTEEGRKVFELCEARREVGQLYDSTRLIIDKNPKFINGEMLYDCMVSWYGQDDAVYFGEGDTLQGRQFEYKHVIAGINPGLMETDPEYLKYALKALFEQKRVNRYLDMALMTEEEIQQARSAGDRTVYPCGKYIGDIKRNDDGRLGKRFNASIGRMMHNTAEMQSKRETFRKEQEARKQARLAAKKAEIARLQAELDEEER